MPDPTDSHAPIGSSERRAWKGRAIYSQRCVGHRGGGHETIHTRAGRSCLDGDGIPALGELQELRDRGHDHVSRRSLRVRDRLLRPSGCRTIAPATDALRPVRRARRQRHSCPRGRRRIDEDQDDKRRLEPRIGTGANRVCAWSRTGDIASDGPACPGGGGLQGRT